jgi:serine/threonine-protein kinase
VALVLQAARGIAKAHARGIVHRDVKPKNLFVTRREDGAESCKVLDFGVAKLTQPSSGISTKTGDMIGTLEYMSPEQVRGDGSVDARTDVYALGCVLYEALSGKRPYGASEPHVVMYCILEGGAAPLATLRAGVPKGVLAVVERAMQRDPQKRFAGTPELIAALAPYATNAAKPLPVTDGAAVTMASAPTSALPAAARATKRLEPRLVALVAAVVAGGVVLGFWRQKPGPAPAVSSAPSSLAATPVHSSGEPKPEPQPSSVSPSVAPSLVPTPSSSRPARAARANPRALAAASVVAPAPPASATPRAKFDLGASPYD